MSATPSLLIDLSPEPDLHPLYPTTAQISSQIGSHSGLDPAQKGVLVAHCLTRACAFGDISVVQYLLSDSQAQGHVDLGLRDEDGIGLISLAIQGFGGDSDRDVEREECVRLLVSQGANIAADNAGWTPLHYAAILSPPTLVSYLMTHGCSPFALTARKLTPLDIVTAHSMMPGKEDIALLLEESMRGQGWTGGRMEQKRRLFEQRMKRKWKQKEIREDVGKVLEVSPEWWGKNSDSSESDPDEDDEEEMADEQVYTPHPDYASMLVFSPPLLPEIFDSLIANFPPRLKDASPANTLYMLARFACLTCDHTWLEDLIIGATDAIEETFFNRAEDLSCLVFWLYNTTIWLHLLQCDTSINEACEMLGSFELIEEVINSVFVFIIRFAERRIDQLLDATMLSFTPMASDFEAVQFESEWSFLRPFAGKRKVPPTSPANRSNTPSSPPSPQRPLSPSHSQPAASSTSRGFSSLRQTITRTRGQSSGAPLSSLFQDSPPSPSPLDLISFLSALHTLLLFSDINPAIITQLWSQVMYWTSCEIFNRVITRKKYICRSRAIQISMNLTAIEDWLEEIGMPRGVQTHFAPVRDLLNWLQCLSSITEFPDLVATIQAMKHMNPLQMRRAVRDYKYEVNEGRMTEECVQYLTQLQKDWERHRVKLGVEALRKEIVERDRDREGSISSLINDSASGSGTAPSIAPSIDAISPQQSIDALLDKTLDKSMWEPVKPPQVLGELLDSRHMLPLLFPSDPRLLAALPGKKAAVGDNKRVSVQSFNSNLDRDRSSSRASVAEPLSWRLRDRKVREVGIGILQWVDGVRSASRWGRPVAYDVEFEDDEAQVTASSVELDGEDPTIRVKTHATPLTRKPSGRTRGRPSMGETTPIDASFDDRISNSRP
ncbi:DIL domain-containing protein [Crassisporium funariophilum]|nr:DIL domain-containing protein [Crassisporium funariophilum]